MYSGLRNSKMQMFVDKVMRERDMRLKQSRQNAERCQRELLRDRVDLERREKLLMKQVKSFAQKGDLVKAKMVAQQIARLRNIADKNFQSSINISTRAQTMLSNHRINKAELEAIKGVGHANRKETSFSVQKRQFMIAQKNHEYEMMELMMNEGMDDVYDEVEENYDTPETFNNEVEAILKEVIDPSHRKEYLYLRANLPKTTGNTVKINLRKYVSANDSNRTLNDSTLDGAVLYIPTMDISVDMLKRELAKDAYAIRQLGLESSEKSTVYDSILGTTKPFQVGTIDQDGNFQQFNFTAGLRQLGLKANDTLWICVANQVESTTHEGKKP